jgi:hypothetical protein
MLKNIIDKILKFYLRYFLIRGKNNRWVDEWIRSALNAKARYGDTPPRPWKPYGFFGLTSDLFIPKVFRAIQKTKELGLDFNKLPKYNPQDYR